MVDGRIVTAGRVTDPSSFTTEIAVVRCFADGTLDASFGGDGRVDLDLPGLSLDPVAVAVQVDGGVYVAGSAHNLFVNDFFVAHFLSNGSLDPGFDGDGIAVTNIQETEYAHSMGIQPDGRVVVVGSSSTPSTYSQFAVVRYNTNGSLDTSFDGDGRAVTAVGIASASAYAVAFQTSTTLPMKLVVGGETYNSSTGADFAIVRYNLDGTLDTTFDGDGRAIVSTARADDRIRSLRILYTGLIPMRILAAGSGRDSSETYDDNVILAKFQLSGVLDTTFDGDGIVRTAISPGYDAASYLALSGGKIVVSGVVSATPLTRPDVLVLRYNSDGSLDTTFDDDGIRMDDVGSSGAWAAALAWQPDGRCVLAGRSYDATGRQVFGVARFEADGTPDTTFGLGGCVSLPMGTGYAEALAVAVQADGRIVVAGVALNGIDRDFALARLTVDGDPDSSFFFDGRVLTAMGPGNDTATGVVILPDGRIVAGGWAQTATTTVFAAARYKPDGSLDPGFGGSSSGKITISVGSGAAFANALVRQPDGRLVLAGYAMNGASNDVAVVRLTAAGVLDPTLDADGRVLTAVGAGNDQANAVAIDGGGHIVVGGSTAVGGVDRFAVLRYNADGTADVTFDSDGQATLSIFGNDDRIYGVGVQPDGAVVVTGESDSGPANLLVVARLSPDGVLDTSFGSGGVTTIGLPNAHNYGAAVVIDPLGRAIVGGTYLTLFGLFRFHGDNETAAVPAVGDGPAPDILRLIGPLPNPTSGSTVVTFEIDLPDRITARIFDITGRRVRDLVVSSSMTAGAHTIRWDGLTDTGTRARAGVYLLKVSSGAGTSTRRIVLAR